MNIGIDARMYGLENAGIGRYIVNVIKEISNLETTNTYTIFLRKKYFNVLKFPLHISKVLADIPHYTIAEQTKLPTLIKKANVDCMHYPHFNIPLLCQTPFIVTIHDLLWHQVKGASVTTLSPLKYAVKYVGYRFVARSAIRRSRAIIVPSNWVKQQILQFHPYVEQKIYPIPEAVDNTLQVQTLKTANKVLMKLGITKPYVLFVGSAYPHKNVRRLIEAMVQDPNPSPPQITLVIASARSVFLNELHQYVKAHGATSQVVFVDFPSDQQLAALLSQASMLVHPSLSEGFGLTGLEAMAQGTPVIAANAGSLPEVYGDAALYVDPLQVEDIRNKIRQVINNPALRKKLSIAGKQRANQYSWKQTALATVKLYNTLFTPAKTTA